MIYFYAQMPNYEEVRRRTMQENERRLRERGFNPIIRAVSENLNSFLNVYDIMTLNLCFKFC